MRFIFLATLAIVMSSGPALATPEEDFGVDQAVHGGQQR